MQEHVIRQKQEDYSPHNHSSLTGSAVCLRSSTQNQISPPSFTGY